MQLSWLVVGALLSHYLRRLVCVHTICRILFVRTLIVNAGYIYLRHRNVPVMVSAKSSKTFWTARRRFFGHSIALLFQCADSSEPLLCAQAIKALFPWLNTFNMPSKTRALIRMQAPYSMHFSQWNSSWAICLNIGLSALWRLTDHIHIFEDWIIIFLKDVILMRQKYYVKVGKHTIHIKCQNVYTFRKLVVKIKCHLLEVC